MERPRNTTAAPLEKKGGATLNPQRAHDAQERAMLAHEAWLAKRMASGRASENLVAVHDPLVESPTAFYLLYEWHGGETLQQMLDR